jgi:putative tricarboxylic transport membrane protein
METAIVFIIGIVSGVLSGILPGVGGLVVMTLAFPFLMTLDPINILIFYVTMVSIDQFFNGITAIIFGIPGNSMSIPTMIEGHAMFRRGEGSTAIMFSALGSWFASLFGVLLIVLMLPILWSIYGLWTTVVQATLLSFAAFILLVVSRNRLLGNILLFGAGSFLAHVGYSEERGTSFFTFDLDLLYSGIPMLPVLSVLFVLPMLLGSLKKQDTFNFPGVSFTGYLQSIKRLKKYTATLIRSSFLGSVGGFVPGMSYGFSSVLAYVSERWLRKKNNRYKLGDTNCLIASESANNAGAFTQLVPLLFLGIPITASEALIYHVLEARNLPVSIEWFSSAFSTVVLFFLVSSTIGLLLAARYVNLLKILNGIKISYVYAGIMLFLFFTIYQTGQIYYSGLEHLIIAFALVPLGLLLVKKDPTPLVFGFILHGPLFDSYERILALYL